MDLKNQIIMIIAIALLYTILSVIVGYKFNKSQSERIKLLKNNIIYDLIFFLISLIILIFLLPKTIIYILNWIIFSFIISYVITIEIPGYISITAYDKINENKLEEIREILINMRYSFNLKDDLDKIIKDNIKLLNEERIIDILNNFISLCNRIGNIDVNLWNLTLNEVTKAINRISYRSKHPFPKLIDILSLTGLSFIIAQLLKTLD